MLEYLSEPQISKVISEILEIMVTFAECWPSFMKTGEYLGKEFAQASLGQSCDIVKLSGRSRLPIA
jgi:hypothetical protein